jgi:crotonobetaine/carnitine-CoA ligase
MHGAPVAQDLLIQPNNDIPILTRWESAVTEDNALDILGEKSQWTMPNLIRRQGKKYGDRPFIEMLGGRSLSYAEFYREGRSVASALHNSGIRHGDRVFLMMENRLEFLLMCIGCWEIGAICVPVNTHLKGFSLEHQLHNSDPAMIFVEAGLLANFADVAPLPKSELTVVVFDGGDQKDVAAAFGNPAFVDFDAFLSRADDGRDLGDGPSPADVGCILYTSGTTGPAKGVLMPHAHLALYSVPIPSLQIGESDVYYCCLPLFHVNGLYTQVFASFLSGARVVCVKKFSPNRWLKEIRECGATLTNLIGLMIELIHKTDRLPDDGHNPLRAMLAMPVADAWISQFCERFGVEICQSFGMTECNIVTYTELSSRPVTGDAGAVRTDLFEVVIVDPETDEPLGDGQLGEIIIRPRIFHAFMQGYLGMHDKTADAWKNLWFHTGDAGRITNGTHLHYVDRIKDRIRRRGENVSAYELEQVILMLPEVAEVAVIGIVAGDAGSEQEVMACIVRKETTGLRAETVVQHCMANAPRFSVPRFVKFLDELPKTVTNRVQKQVLRNEGAHGAWDRESIRVSS